MSKDLTVGSIKQHVWQLSFPMMLGMLSIIVFNLVDTYFIGKLGADPLAAIGFTFPVILFMGSISFGLTMAMTSLVSRYIGEGKRTELKASVSNNLLFALILVIALSALGQLTLEPVFELLGAQDHLMPLIKQYMRIWYFSIVFLLIPMMGNGAIRGLGDTKSPAIIMVVAGLSNAIFDPLLIFGYWGFPKLGIAGAAYYSAHNLGCIFNFISLKIIFDTVRL